ncbi:hypothetical protein L3X38_043018 [Prunus dulcis]|uniref:Uncharacterized protein n=1 Tax=Prunus dulcis TaxID=3755 RepID=A0AAD4UXM6_PRUDU|nr:hypothetical protein L3X38_043018 [Prunus dulcis]
MGGGHHSKDGNGCGEISDHAWVGDGASPWAWRSETPGHGGMGRATCGGSMVGASDGASYCFVPFIFLLLLYRLAGGMFVGGFGKYPNLCI